MVTVLFARRDSVYKKLPGIDVWDIERDARLWPGGTPVIAHPPCRAWGRLRHFAKPRCDEKELARYAVRQVRQFGGVLEHPSASTLWTVDGLPKPGHRDDCGGWTLGITQHWFGHRAEKATWLYIVGCEPSQTPQIQMLLGDATHVISQRHRLADGSRLKKGMPGWRPETSKNERERTPYKLAVWLVELARRCNVQQIALRLSATGGAR